MSLPNPHPNVPTPYPIRRVPTLPCPYPNNLTTYPIQHFMATGMTNSAGSKICGEKGGSEDSSKISDRADCPDAEYDDTADHTEPSDNNGTITDQKQQKTPTPQTIPRRSP